MSKENNNENSAKLTLEALYDVPVQVSVVLGRTTMQLSNILKLGRGAVIELERHVGEPIDVYVNNKIIAKGEIVVVDNKIGVTLTEVVSVDKEHLR
jgi:flagellar motor switch protein FliN/FliY